MRGGAGELVKTIKLERAAIGLPFALISAFAAVSGWPRGWVLLWAVVAAVAAGAAAEASHAYRRRLNGWVHWVVGLGLGLAPVGVWAAARGGVGMAPVLLGGALLFWAAGFDLMAACADIATDREQGVFTVPARWGARKAAVMSSGSHLVAFWLLAIFGEVAGLGWLYLSGVILLVPVVYVMHRMGAPETAGQRKIAWLPAAAVLGVVLLLFAAADVIVVGSRMRF
jgi:4-hydroxybenzoate polyprenyltransferase